MHLLTILLLALSLVACASDTDSTFDTGPDEMTEPSADSGEGVRGCQRGRGSERRRWTDGGLLGLYRGLERRG